MKKRTIFDRLRQWDESEFEVIGALPLDEPVRRIDPQIDREALTPIPALEHGGVRTFRRIYPWMAGLLALVLVAFLLLAVLDLPPFGAADAPAHNEVMDRYVREGMAETGAVNAVAGVILDYRAFDTLGESHVLFTASAAVLILLLTGAHVQTEPRRIREIMEADPILRNTARVLTPVILLFGLYVILNGHLGPGGGFAGGAIVGGGLILYTIAFGFSGLERWMNERSCGWIIAGCLCFYSLAKCYSFFCGANGLETIFSPGSPGRILSAGLILPLNAAVGMVVACTMYGFYAVFQRGRI